MPKTGQLMETGAEHWPIPESRMRRSPGQDGNAPRPSRAVSVFGHGTRPPLKAPLVPGDTELRSALMPFRHDPGRIWNDLAPLRLDPDLAARHHLIVTHREDPVGLLYDHLRTRLVQALGENGWNRVLVTAPTQGCGASTIAANLALSLARRPSGRTVLIDLDLRQPSLARMFGLSEPGPLRDVLTGAQPIEAHFRRLGHTLALGLNGRAEPDPAELLQEPDTAHALEAVLEDLAPDVTICDMPAMLECDDLLAALPEADAVLLVVDGTRTTAAHVRECERLLKDRSPLLGVVLNRAEDSPVRNRRS